MGGPFTTATELVGAEWLKIRTTRMYWVFAIVAAVFTGGLVTLIAALIPAEELALTDDALLGFTMPGAIVGLLMLVVGVLGMAGEFRHGTITYTFLAAPHRERVVLLKLGVYFVVGVVAAVAALLLTQLLLMVILPLRGLDILWPHGDIWSYYGKLLLTTGLFAAFGVALGALLRSQVLAVALTLSWMVLEVTIIPPLLLLAGLDQVQQWLPLNIFFQATGMAEAMGGEEAGQLVMSAGKAMLVGVGYIAVVAVVSVFTTMRRDVT